MYWHCRAVTSIDEITTGGTKFDNDFLKLVSNKIINRVQGINRIVYDISSKPPSTTDQMEIINGLKLSA